MCPDLQELASLDISASINGMEFKWKKRGGCACNQAALDSHKVLLTPASLYTGWSLTVTLRLLPSWMAGSGPYGPTGTKTSLIKNTNWPSEISQSLLQNTRK